MNVLLPRTRGHIPPLPQDAHHVGQVQPPSESRAHEVIGTAASVFAVCVIIVGLRLFTRIHLLRSFSLDDSLIIIATLCAAALTGLLIHATYVGLGKHVDEIATSELTRMTLHMWVAYIFLNFTLGITKISIVLFYLRLFTSMRWMKTACIIFLYVILANTVVSVTCCILTCRPISLFWHLELATSPTILKEHCVDFKVMWLTQDYIYISFDLILIVLPIPVVKSLWISRREKAGLAIIFAIGGLGCLCSFLRLRSLGQAVDSEDPGWDNVNSARWTVIEVAIGIICASLPHCKAFLTKIYPHILSPNRGRKGVIIPISWFDKGHGWMSQLERGTRADTTQRRQMSLKGGLVQSIVEKGGIEWSQDQILGGEGTGASTILVTTTMTQRRESNCSNLEVM